MLQRLEEPSSVGGAGMVLHTDSLEGHDFSRAVTLLLRYRLQPLGKSGHASLRG